MLLIFATADEARVLSKHLDVPILLGHNMGALVPAMHDGRVAAVIVVGAVHGWRAPSGSTAVFTEGYPKDGPLRFQAEGRLPFEGATS